MRVESACYQTQHVIRSCKPMPLPAYLPMPWRAIPSVNQDPKCAESRQNPSRPYQAAIHHSSIGPSRHAGPSVHTVSCIRVVGLDATWQLTAPTLVGAWSDAEARRLSSLHPSATQLHLQLRVNERYQVVAGTRVKKKKKKKKLGCNIVVVKKKRLFFFLVIRVAGYLDRYRRVVGQQRAGAVLSIC
ncbi:hypothetical protein LZ31DRAFT_175088 [Colletotrichum somersetense]|nr:hypothetical protein LZ31DRAFT_175088 [Colletotrichum somersetense]